MTAAVGRIGATLCASVDVPGPAPGTASSRPATGATSPSRAATGTPPTAAPSAVAACDLLNPEQIREFGLDPGTATPVDAGGLRQYTWTAEPGASATPPLSVVIGSPGAGSGAVPPLPGSSVEQTELEGYLASVVSAEGLCLIVVRADAGTVAVSGGGKDCDATRAIARAAVGNLT